MVANRSVGTGSTASAVFLSWIWINESVFSGDHTYKWGIALPIWWASGLPFQIALMAMLGIVAKLRVPYAHTSLEIIKMRYGKYAHWLFILLNLIKNIFGCGGMILAGAQLVTGIMEMHVIAACILIPQEASQSELNAHGVADLGAFPVVTYTAVGGLKATFLTDFLHTTITLILLIYFSLAVLTNEHIGGISGLYEKVKATDDYIVGSFQGSLLTMKSESAVLFGLVLKFGNLALVLMDTAFWQKSFAPEVNSSLVMPYMLKSLLGRGANVGLLVLIFMAITSTVSSSMIAVSGIISQDFFCTYINLHASDRKILKSGAINIQTTQIQLPGLYAAIISFFSPALYSVVISLIWPSRFDRREFLRIDLIKDKSQATSSLPSKILSSEAINETLRRGSDFVKGVYLTSGEESVRLPRPPSTQPNAHNPLDEVVHPFDEKTLRHTKRWLKIASVYFVVNVLVTIVLWPLPLYRDWIFTKSFFGGWVSMANVWHFSATFAVIIYPIYDGRHEIARAYDGMVKELKEIRG
ncbi:hypothetical protein BP5796_09256 [Coleophoma crateriformis]|uniref:Uncharacterized protein n=1 Tax=Coleophoma crateriformis TaxID=565419 RepID=A0A3D8R3I0_9HELO|nr:hypothetical protein BP5796_09256 [Coleophoma crateriformis]